MGGHGYGVLIRSRSERSSWTLYIQKARNGNALHIEILCQALKENGSSGMEQGRGRATYLDSAVQRTIIDALELLLNGLQIDLRTADNNANQCGVIGAGAIHGLVQSIGEKCCRRLDALNWQGETNMISCISTSGFAF